MISKELTAWFQEEVKKEIADVIDDRESRPMTISLFDEKGIVWMEGVLSDQELSCDPGALQHEAILVFECFDPHQARNFTQLPVPLQQANRFSA